MGELLKNHFSRAIYRELAPLILNDRQHQGGSNRRRVLQGCERTMERLVRDRRHFARPARSLFNEIRVYFSLCSQLHVYTIVKRHIDTAVAMLEMVPEEQLDPTGTERQCQAMTRKGQPCQRPPLARSEYCPSHQHLRESFDELEGIELAA